MLQENSAQPSGQSADASGTVVTGGGLVGATEELLSQRLTQMQERMSESLAIITGNNADDTERAEMLVAAEAAGGEVSAGGEPVGAQGNPTELMAKIVEMMESRGENAVLAQANQLPSGAMSHANA